MNAQNCRVLFKTNCGVGQPSNLKDCRSIEVPYKSIWNQKFVQTYMISYCSL